MSEYWRLCVILSEGSNVSLVGGEQEFREVQKQFCEGDTFGKISIAGITDTADRAPIIVAFNFENVIALSLVKLYG